MKFRIKFWYWHAKDGARYVIERKRWFFWEEITPLSLSYQEAKNAVLELQHTVVISDA